MLINKELTSKMEGCIKQTHIEVTKQYSQGKILELNGGAACFSGFDSFLSQVVGWGFATKRSQFKNEIETIEDFYKSFSHPRVDIELCPFVGRALTEYLSQRGYRVAELNNVSVIDLKAYKKVILPEDQFSIKHVVGGELETWAKRVAYGFGYPEAQEQFLHYVRALGTATFAVYKEEQIVAGATVAIHGDVGDFAVTSTLPAYRNKGLQKRLMHARLNFVKEQGLSLATVTTEPGTISDLNVQKAGFRCAYTRVRMTRVC
jgi:GNAT superfamily N-acetyltransferase